MSRFERVFLVVFPLLVVLLLVGGVWLALSLPVPPPAQYAPATTTDDDDDCGYGTTFSGGMSYGCGGIQLLPMTPDGQVGHPMIQW